MGDFDKDKAEKGDVAEREWQYILEARYESVPTSWPGTERMVTLPDLGLLAVEYSPDWVGHHSSRIFVSITAGGGG